MKKLFPLLLVISFVLTGCTQLALEGANQMKKVSDQVSRNLTQYLAVDENKPDDPLYCYRTLAKPVCYERPLVGQGDRLIAYYGPRPVTAEPQPMPPTLPQGFFDANPSTTP